MTRQGSESWLEVDFLRGVNLVPRRFPRITELADSLAQAHGKSGDGLDLRDSLRRKPIAAGEQEFSVTENSGERVVHLMAEQLAEVFGIGRGAICSGDALGETEAAIDEPRSNVREISRAGNDVGSA